MKLHLSFDQFRALYAIHKAAYAYTRFELIEMLWMPSVASRISELRIIKGFNLPLIEDSDNKKRKRYILSSLDKNKFKEYLKTKEAKEYLKKL